MRAQGSSPQLSSVKCVFIGQLIFSATGGNDEISRLESRVRVIEFWILAVVAWCGYGIVLYFAWRCVVMDGWAG